VALVSLPVFEADEPIPWRSGRVHNHFSRAGLIDESGRRLHRELAYASVSVATVGYLLMLFR